MIGMSDKKTARPYFRKYFLRSLTSLFHVWSLNRDLTSNPSSSLTLKMTCFPPMRFSGSGRKTKVGWLVIVVFSKQTLWRPWFMSLVGQKKKKTGYICLWHWLLWKVSALCFQKVPGVPLVGAFRFLKPGGHFLCVWIPVLNPSPRGVHEHLFSKMKAQAETRAVLQNSLFLDFFFNQCI